MRDRSGLSARDASAYAREYKTSTWQREQARRRVSLARRARAAWQAWREAGSAADG